MPSFWEIVNRVIEQSDVLLEVLDARLIDKTRNIEIENKVRQAGKKLIFVLNKADLLTYEEMKQKKRELSPCVFVSCTMHQGTMKLREAIMKAANYKERIVVGVLGYPNTGKSSLINAIKGRAAAPTSAQSGYTKGIQKVSVGGGIMLLDTPGVIPYQEKTDYKHAITSAVDPSKVKNPDVVVADFIVANPGMLEAHYGVETHDDPMMTIEEIAVKRGKIKRGGVANFDAASRMILQDIHRGRILHKEKS